MMNNNELQAPRYIVPTLPPSMMASPTGATFAIEAPPRGFGVDEQRSDVTPGNHKKEESDTSFVLYHNAFDPRLDVSFLASILSQPFSIYSKKVGFVTSATDILEPHKRSTEECQN
jgi:hypothetical protein